MFQAKIESTANNCSNCKLIHKKQIVKQCANQNKVQLSSCTSPVVGTAIGDQEHKCVPPRRTPVYSTSAETRFFFFNYNNS